MSVNNVLVVESDIDRCEMLSTLIEFINCQPVVITESDLWFEHVENLDDVVMAIVGDCGGQNQTKQLLRELVNHDSRVPVFVLESSSGEALDFPGTIGSIRYPIKYPQLSNALQQATIYRGMTAEAITFHPEEINPLCQSIVGPFQESYWKVSYLVMKKALLPGQ